jgi:quercetin dioxygenase-like cupin family protein
MNTTTAITSTRQAYVSHQGEALWYFDGLLEFLVPSDATGGALSVFRATMPEGSGPPRHVHTREDEVILVLEGTVRFEADGEHTVGGPGTAVFVPRGVPHSFRVESEVAVTLAIITPGAFEQMFRAASVPAEARTLPTPRMAPVDFAAVSAVQAELGAHVVGPPLTAEDA